MDEERGEWRDDEEAGRGEGKIERDTSMYIGRNCLSELTTVKFGFQNDAFPPLKIN